LVIGIWLLIIVFFILDMAIVIFAGEDSFRLQMELKKFLEKEAPGAPFRIFDSASEAELNRELTLFFQTPGLWQERRIAVVKIPKWEGRLPEIRDPDLLVLALGKTPASGIRSNVRLEEFPPLQGAELSRWIRKTAKELGNAVSADLVSALMEIHGSDTGSIWNELMVLSCFKPGKILTASDLKKFRAWIPRVRDFAFIEAVSTKDRKEALRLLLASLNEGVTPLAMLGSLESHFRAMLVAKAGGKAAAEFFAGRHPYWVSKIKQAASAFNEVELKTYLARLWRTKFLIKTGKHLPEIALEEFVLGV
jgi:DNA polymerase III delta subunit